MSVLAILKQQVFRQGVRMTNVAANKNSTRVLTDKLVTAICIVLTYMLMCVIHRDDIFSDIVLL